MQSTVANKREPEKQQFYIGKLGHKLYILSFDSRIKRAKKQLKSAVKKCDRGLRIYRGNVTTLCVISLSHAIRKWSDCISFWGALRRDLSIYTSVYYNNSSELAPISPCCAGLQRFWSLIILASVFCFLWASPTSRLSCELAFILLFPVWVLVSATAFGIRVLTEGCFKCRQASHRQQSK